MMYLFGKARMADSSEHQNSTVKRHFNVVLNRPGGSLTNRSFAGAACAQIDKR